jgi:LPS sulfotransferase NodH
MIQPFVLLSTQRSGSTWAIDMLDSHPAVIAYSELLLEGARGTPQWGGTKDLVFWNDYRDGERAGRPDAPRRELLFAYLDRVYEPRGQAGAIGFKLMYGQFGAFPELADYMRSRGLAVIHLIRENLIDILVSKETAVRRDVFHSRGGERLDEIRIRLEAGQLLKRLEAQGAEVQRARRAIADLGVRCMEVVYEDLMSDPGLFERLLAFLGVSADPTALRSSLRKLNRASHEEIVENYGEVAAVLRGTRFAGMLR